MNGQPGQPFRPNQQEVEYSCADCAAGNTIKPREPIRCRECGCRVMYKKRIKRIPTAPVVALFTKAPIRYTEMLERTLRFPDTPQTTLQAQLVPGVEYITTMVRAGQSNQFLALMKVILLECFLGKYDLPSFFEATHIPAIPLSSFKSRLTSPTSPQHETLQCWSLLETAVGIRNNRNFSDHAIDTNFWAFPDFPRDDHLHPPQFDPVATFLGSKQAKKAWLQQVRDRWLPQKLLVEGAATTPISLETNVKDGFDPQSRVTPLDNPQLTCLDSTFYMSDDEVLPPRESGAPWREVGQHLRFTPRVEAVKMGYLRRIFKVPVGRDRIPPFISVHIRRGDFATYKGNSMLSLSRYQEGVEEVRRLLREKIDLKDYSLERFTTPPERYEVLATTDEPHHSEFVKEIEALGWKVVDHHEFFTAELGDWWAPVLDAAMLASAQGFVGTYRSTFSRLAAMRVESWNGGVSIIARENAEEA
ncbi:hypothetical protein MNV49_007150 [Pseudohyphozyma bogoriensis]|nr:hypothetical protein MNV49_007150 [Pseudohyphozyma bogoriensis]